MAGGTLDPRYTTLSPSDVHAWSELTNLLARVDGTEEFYGPDDLAEELNEPGFSASLDSVAVWAGDQLVGYGQLRVGDRLTGGLAKATIDGGVHPVHRGRGIGQRIMDRLEPRAVALAAERHPGVPLALDLWAGPAGSGAGRLAAARGYAPARYFTDMRVELEGDGTGPEDADPPVDEPGLEDFRPDLAEAVRRAHNEAFADHWGSVPRSEEKWADQLASRSFRPALSKVVLSTDSSLDPAERVDAYALCNEWVPGELYVSLVGTRRRARRRGLAALLLGGVVRSAARSGYRMVDLTVDSESPTGAGRIYERVGFNPVRTSTVYQRLFGEG
ncbi:GNAT family N-acetyltransferase [Arthrobacter sp. JSM 101049]|uniref:GNAT family N-acetyltransferase n=1 Tax=Arthrobacter sp. JSM 101049 TaxID=929097 RepID=UPI0035652F2D